MYGGFAFLATAMTLMGAMLYFSYSASRWSADSQRSYWAVVAAILVVLAGLTIFFMRRAPKTPL